MPGKIPTVDYEIRIKMTSAHLDVLIKALDLYSRIHMGQLDEILNILDADINEYKAKEMLNKIKKYVYPKLQGTGYYGITSSEIGDEPKIAYDLQQVLRNKRAWLNKPEGANLVDFDTPMKTSVHELPEAELKKAS